MYWCTFGTSKPAKPRCLSRYSQITPWGGHCHILRPHIDHISFYFVTLASQGPFCQVPRNKRLWKEEVNRTETRNYKNLKQTVQKQIQRWKANTREHTWISREGITCVQHEFWRTPVVRLTPIERHVHIWKIIHTRKRTKILKRR